MNLLLNFIKSFAVKYFGTEALERLILLLLKAVVERTDSKLDDEIYNAVFEKTNTKGL